MSRILTRHAFNLGADPWGDLSIQTADATRVETMVRAAVGPMPRTNHNYGQAMVSILGERGIGKNCAVQAALDKCPGAKVVWLQRLTREKTHMGDIEDAIISEISRESPRRSGEARSRQLRRLLGEAQEKNPVVLVLDDAHRFHPNTLRGLKRLREMSWTGRRCLIGIILIAQRDAAKSVDEVGLRSDAVWMEGLTKIEAFQALNLAIGTACDHEALQALADSNTVRKTWLDLQAASDQVLESALADGRNKVSLKDVVLTIGAGLKAMAQEAGITQSAIAKAVGGSETQVSRVMSGERTDADLQNKITDFLLGQQPKQRKTA